MSVYTPLNTEEVSELLMLLVDGANSPEFGRIHVLASRALAELLRVRDKKPWPVLDDRQREALRNVLLAARASQTMLQADIIEFVRIVRWIWSGFDIV